jgi:hypothetical protein
MNKIFSVVIVSLMSFGALFAQSPEKVVNERMQQIRTKSTVNVDLKTVFNPDNTTKALSALEKYYTDTTKDVRIEAYNTAALLALKSSNLAVKQKVITQMVNTLTGNDADVSFISIKNLIRFSATDFPVASILKIQQAVNEVVNNKGKLARLAAFVCGPVVAPNLSQLLRDNPTLNSTIKSDIKMAMARAGNENLQNKMVQKCKQQVLNNDFVYDIVPELVYTRNKIVFDFLLEAILRDTKDCTSANNDDTTPMTCAYRLIEQVAPYIINFPAKLDEVGELKTKDYPALLTEVRSWINANKNTYQLNQTIY